MIIHCPNCQTQYSVDPSGFGSVGRMVRCFNCANQWHQHPVTVNVPRPAAMAAPAYTMPGHPQPGYPPAAYAGYPPPPGYPPGYPPPGYPPPGYPPAPEHPTAAPDELDMFDSEPEPEMDFPDVSMDMDDDIDDEPEMDISSGIDALFESDDDDDFPVPEPESAPDDPISDLSQDDLDSMFEGQDDPGEVASMVDSGGGDTADDVIDIDDIPDPDPLPQSLTEDAPDDGLDDDDDDDEVPVRRRIPAKKKKSKAGLIISLVLVLLLAGLGGGLFFLQSMVVEMVPAMSSVYEMVGLKTPLGEGLDIGRVSPERTTEAGVDYMIIKGVVTNSTDADLEVPFIKVTLIDSDGVGVQTVVQELEAAMLGSGETLNFAVTIEEPSLLARSLDVTWVTRTAEDMQ